MNGLECPVSCQTITPPLEPMTCGNGHMNCRECYEKIDKCPMCRIWLVKNHFTTALYCDNPQDQIAAAQYFRKLLVNMKDMTDPQRNEVISAIVKNGLVPRFVELLRSTDNTVLYEALWVLTNIATGTSLQTRSVIDAGAVPILVGLVLSQQRNVQDSALWALANIVGDSPELRDFVLEHDIFPPLFEVLTNSTHRGVTREAVWLLRNICYHKSPLPDYTKLAPLLSIVSKLLNHNDNVILEETCWTLSSMLRGIEIQEILHSRVCSQLVELIRQKKVEHVALSVLGNIMTILEKKPIY